MQASINQLVGSNLGNTSSVGAAGSGASSDNVGGGYLISEIYKRALTGLLSRGFRFGSTGSSLVKRTLANSTTGYSWYGVPAGLGLPLPGNYSGFAGTLSEENIPASNAFMTGFLWFLILVALVAASVVLLKGILEVLSLIKLLRRDRLTFFRTHWLGFTALAILRTLFIGFFMMLFLTLFQFTYKGSPGVTAIAAIVFVVFFVGLLGVAGYACYYRMRGGRYTKSRDRVHIERTQAFGFVPWYGFTRESNRSEKSNPKPSFGSLPWWKITHTTDDPQYMEVHQDEDYNKKFGWLSARFRRTRWWFFAAWLVYEFIRACFYGGAAGEPLVQVFGLLVVEFVTLILLVIMKPFEGARLNALMVYILGVSKVATLALSAAFDHRFNLPRIITTAIGVVIIVIQGFLTIALLILIVIGAISSYMSITRNREDFRPRHWAPLREKYFAHIKRAALDRPPSPPPLPEEPKEPYFNVGSVRRIAKIEDEDDKFGGNDPYGSNAAVVNDNDPMPGSSGNVRANSVQSNRSNSNLPYGARPHRASWTSRDFSTWHDRGNHNSELMSRSGMQSTRSDRSLREAYQQHSRAPSRAGPIEVRKSRNGKEKEHVPSVEEKLSDERKPIEEEGPSQEQ